VRSIGYILLAGALGVAGQLILKRGLTALGPLTLRPETLVETGLALAFSPVVIIGLVVYLSGTFFWLIALSRADLSYAYPFASLNYVLVLLSAWWLLGEQPSPTRLIGVAVICFGVWAIARTPISTAARGAVTRSTTAPALPGGPE
jgi:drug/metabolite transporter (DMT)-like permease